MIEIIREICKLFMLIFLWSFPILLYYWSRDSRVFFFYILSAILTTAVLSHYETLEDFKNSNNLENNNTDE